MNPQPHNPRILAIVLALCAIFAFFPSIWGGYIWDDDTLLTANPLVTSHGAHGLAEIWKGVNSRDYTPLTISTFWLEWHVWGANPIGYHLVNLLLHAAAAVLLWRILAALRIPGAWLGALFFAIHPINASSAAWVAELKNTLSAVFFLASLLAFLQAYIQRDQRWLAPSVVLFLVAGLCKGAVVTLPIVLAACIIWMNRRLTRSDLLRLFPFFVISGFIAIITIHYQSHAENYHLIPDSFPHRIARAGCAVWWYLREIFLPIGLDPMATQWPLHLHSFLTWLPAIGAAILFLLLYWCRDSWARPLFFAYSIFLWMLLPILGFVWMALQQETPAADWWEYLAAPAIFACIAAGYSIALRDAVRGVRVFLQVSLGLILALLFLQSWRRSITYQGMDTYCVAVINEDPHAWILQNNLGVILKQNGQFVEAIAHYEQALSDNPHYVEAINNLANAWTATGSIARAEAGFTQALALRPNDPQILSGYAQALFLSGKTDQAYLAQRAAIHQNPTDPGLYTQFGRMLSADHKYPEAITCFNRALQLLPADFDTRVALIRALLAAGHHDEAAAQCRPLLEAAHAAGDEKRYQLLLPLLNQALAAEPPQP